jgi:ABC-2 type transport system ATP-binding protein
MTIVISSHLLSEIEKLATHVGILSKGKLLFEGRIEGLQSLMCRQSMLRIITSDNDKAFEVLQDYNPERTWRELLVPYHSPEDIARVNQCLNANDIGVHLLQPKENNLEQLFIELTK